MERTKKKYSPHLSIKRLRELAEEYIPTTKYVSTKTVEYIVILKFIAFVESQRSSLISKHVKK